MLPFKRGFVEKCAEFGIEKEAAKELFNKMKKNLEAHEAGESAAKEKKEEMCAKSAGVQDDIMAFLSAHRNELVGGGVGAGIGTGAGALLGDDKTRGRNMAIGGLGGGALGALGGGGAFGQGIPDLLNKLLGGGQPPIPKVHGVSVDRPVGTNEIRPSDFTVNKSGKSPVDNTLERASPEELRAAFGKK